MDEYPKARKANSDSLGSQSWWLFTRIREVDVFLQRHDEALSKTNESHPELCFRALADHELRSKSTEKSLKTPRTA
jgi:predicted RNase H-like nuclease